MPPQAIQWKCMEPTGTGFQTIIERYEDCNGKMQPVISIYPGREHIGHTVVKESVKRCNMKDSTEANTMFEFPKME